MMMGSSPSLSLAMLSISGGRSLRQPVEDYACELLAPLNWRSETKFDFTRDRHAVLKWRAGLVDVRASSGNLSKKTQEHGKLGQGQDALFTR
jgi:hypothetical protein